MKLTTSPRLNLLLEAMGLFTPLDVLNHFPRRYDSFLYTPSEALRCLEDKQKVVLYGEALTRPRLQRFRNVTLVKFIFRNEANREDYAIEAWNRPYLCKTIELNKPFTLQGSFDAKGHCLNLLSLKSGKIPPEEALIPIYSLPADYPEHSFRQLLSKCLKESEGQFKDLIPSALRAKYSLLSKEEAIHKVHFPTSTMDVKQSLRVLKYEEALLFSLKNQLIRAENRALSAPKKGAIPVSEVRSFIASLPYPLTNDQKKAVNEAYLDMQSDHLMYRLLQGDVGTGKTLVAAILLYANACRKEQGAMLAPTDALARQHYETLVSLYRGTKVKVELLVGALSFTERREALARIASGEADIVVGTHALFSKDVTYKDLGLAIIDEQHKFGVNQRSLLAEKGDAADVLLMSATPIPRTLSLTVYGDLDVSILAEFPASARKVTTRIVKPETKAVAKAIAASLISHHRVYVVAPQIELAENEESSAKAVYAAYEKAYPGLVTLLHGKLSQEEKEKAIASFKEGETPILISTQVIEVGIDVKAANLMVIYDPTHFSLSSLHQLRGRIGRDGSEASCLLVYGGSAQEDLDKLNVLVSTEDGFAIAEEDLRRRGPGEFGGLRQSGFPDFTVANILTDFKMFEFARNDAAEILRNPALLDNRAILAKAKETLEGKRY